MFNIFTKKTKSEAGNSQITLKIEGMHCTSCAMNIDDALEELDGVISAQTSYAQGKVAIEYKESLVNVKSLIDTIEKDGYIALPPKV